MTVKTPLRCNGCHRPLIRVAGQWRCVNPNCHGHQPTPDQKDRQMTLTHLDEEVVRSRHPRGHRLTTNPATSPHAWRRRPEPTTRRHEDPMLLAVRTFVVPAGPYAGEQIIAGQYWCRASHWLVKTFPDAWAER